MSEEKTHKLGHSALESLLLQDSGVSQRLSHRDGEALTGDSQTRMSEALEEWEDNMSGPLEAYRVMNIGKDPMLLEELRKAREEIQTEVGHKIDVQKSYTLECEPSETLEGRPSSSASMEPVCARETLGDDVSDQAKSIWPRVMAWLLKILN